MDCGRCRTTSPERLRDAVRDLYKYEIKRLRADLLAERFLKNDYASHVVELRKRYPLLSIPVDLWLVNDKSVGSRLHTHEGLRKAGPFLSRPTLRSGHGRGPGRAGLVRFARSGDARGRRRHDRKREDRPLPGSDRGSRHRRHSRAGHRSEGRSGQSAADVPAVAPAGFPAVDR